MASSAAQQKAAGGLPLDEWCQLHISFGELQAVV
jgi:hypothetical protein